MKNSVKKSMKASIKNKTLLVVIIATLYCASVSVYISYKTYSNTIDTYYKDTITDIAKSAGALMDADRIGEYADRLERDDEYDHMLDTLKKIKNNNDIAYLYVEKVVGNKAIAIMDTDTENPMGFRETFKVSERADTSSIDDGVPAFISDEEGVGWMCSVFVPIKNSSGETVALVGADMSMDDVMYQRHEYLFGVCVAIVLVTVLAGVIMVLMITKLVVNPINKVAEATTNFVSFHRDGEDDEEESPIEKLDIKSNDEIGNLAKSVKIMEKEIHQYISDLTSVTAEKERIGAELNVATQIQADMLPRIFPAFPEYSEFDIYATMSPAKEVGGDFYDYFMADEDHLVMVMADVSGKGVPAALFMVIAKTLIKNTAQTISSPKEILEKVNNDLCENNEAEMFVTTWLGIVELSTGILRAANAGHEYPVIKRANGDFELYKDKHGFVLAGMEMTKYKEYEIQLGKKDMLYLYTDGVPEATNSNNELYGTDRMLAVLNRNRDASLVTLLGEVRKDIDSFVGDAPQFDDITMMGFILYNTGEKEPDSLTVTPDEVSVSKVAEFVESTLNKAEIPDKIVMKINIVTDEIYSNIVRCSNAKSATVYCNVSEGNVELVFEDDGIEYNPLEAPDPDITLSAENRKIGGLGVFIVKKTMDELHYEYKDGKNILSLSKKIR